MMLAVGDGSSTSGLLEKNKIDDKVENYGVLLFQYPFDDKNFLPDVQRLKKINVTVEDNSAIHFSIMGIDNAGPVIIAVKINGYYCCFYCSAKDIMEDNEKFYEARTIKAINNINAFYNSKSHHLYPLDIPFDINDKRKLITKEQLTYYDSEKKSFIKQGNIVAYYDENINELQIKNGQEIELALYTFDSDEVQLLLNVIETTNKTKQVILHLHNLFEDDRFELERTKKAALLDNRKKEFEDIINSILYNPSNLNVEVILRGNFVGKDTNPKSTQESKLISDKSYYFDIPYSSRKSELAGGDNLEAYKYSYAKIEYNNSRLTINIESYVSPVRSRLDRRMQDDNYTLLTEEAKQAKINELNQFTLYGNNANSDAYVELEDHSRIPSYNPILSAFRSFGVLEAIRDILIDEAKVLGKTPEEIEAISNVLDIDNRSIKVDLTKGIAKEIKYTDYNDFKWYRDATEESKFKNTEN